MTVLKGGMNTSQWTHVNASFRLDSIGEIDDETLINIFGGKCI